jgi:hypothetical protein
VAHAVRPAVIATSFGTRGAVVPPRVAKGAILQLQEGRMGSAMARPIGIDLGTTNSAIALINDYGRPEIIP